MESRTDAHAADSAVLSRRQKLRSSKSADRLTPAHPERELVESDSPKRCPAPYRHRQSNFAPKSGAKFASLNPHHPTRLLKGSRQKMKMHEIEAMMRAIAAYAGPVTQCAPGTARAKPVRRNKAVDEATRWLRRHRHDVSVPRPFVDDNVDGERGRRRKARAERKRMRRAANAVARKRIREQ